MVANIRFGLKRKKNTLAYLFEASATEKDKTVKMRANCGAKTPSITTFSITTFSTMTLSITIKIGPCISIVTLGHEFRFC